MGLSSRINSLWVYQAKLGDIDFLGTVGSSGIMFENLGTKSGGLYGVKNVVGDAADVVALKGPSSRTSSPVAATHTYRSRYTIVTFHVLEGFSITVFIN